MLIRKGDSKFDILNKYLHNDKMDKIDQLIDSLLTFTLILFQEIQYQGSSKEAV